MKKYLVVISFIVSSITPSFASTPLFPNFMIEKLKQPTTDGKKNINAHDGYANFSGQWVGTCDNEPDQKESMTIKQSPDASLILWDNIIFPIDAISTNGFNGNFETENNVVHLRWGKDGQQILSTGVAYHKAGNMSQAGMDSVVLKSIMSIENKQLIIAATYSYFSDGTLSENDAYRCIYTLHT